MRVADRKVTRLGLELEVSVADIYQIQRHARLNYGWNV